MRTVTEMSMGILVWADPKVDSEKADNIAAILVCTTILAIAMYIAYETIVLIREEIEIRSKPVPMLTTTSIVVNTREADSSSTPADTVAGPWDGASSTARLPQRVFHSVSSTPAPPPSDRSASASSTSP